MMRYRLLTIFALFLCGCEEQGGPVQEITETRTATARDAMPNTVSSEQRFGFTRPAGGGGDPHGGTMGGGGTVAASSGERPYEWITPTGWEELAPSSMRLANFQIGGAGGAECYFTVMGGGGGGVLANVNRWRNQIGLDPITDAEVGALPTMALLSSEAKVVSLSGAYKGMGDTAEAGFGLLGLVMVEGGQAFFVKMTGPEAVLVAERGNFEAFVASLRPHDHARDHAAHTQTAAAPVEETAPTQQISPPAAPTGDMLQESQLAWDAPAGWLLAADRSMRVVTYMVGGAECAISIWPGTMGGVSANVNRWRNQMGQPPMSAAAIQAGEKIEVLGVPSTLTKIEGSYKDMAGNSSPDAMMYGIVCPLPEQVLFLKLTGPKADIADELKNFIAFSKSIRVGG
jgi:hypothetical protein